jgi:hypothetical protein
MTQKKSTTKTAKPKRPVEPQKPYAPTKPALPQKEIEGYETLSALNLGNYDSFSYNGFLEELKVEGKDASKLHIYIECEVEHGYYDDVTAKATIKITEAKMVPNPSYTYMQSRYADDMKRYEKAKAKYDKDCITYKDKLQAYKEALPAWQAYENELHIKHLEKQLKKLKKEK